MSYKSKFDYYTKEQLQEMVDSSDSIRDFIKKVGLCGNGAGSYSTFYKKAKELGIDVSLIRNRGRHKARHYLQNNCIKEKIKYEDILTENSNYSRIHLKNRLLKDCILENKCFICGQLPMWNGMPLTLQLDHINGIPNDNRIENLRILCPHCHSQQETTGSKKLKIHKPVKNSINEKEKINIEIVKNSNIDFSKFGWVTRVAELIKKHPQKINNWMKKYLPEILEKSFRKNIQVRTVA